MADFATTAEALFSAAATVGTATAGGGGSGYAVGARVERALVMAVAKRVVALSVKPLLLAAAAAKGGR